MKSKAPIKIATIKEMPITIPVRRIVSSLFGQETFRISARTSFKKIIGDAILKNFSISGKIKQYGFGGRKRSRNNPYYLRLPSIEAAIRQQVHIMDNYRIGKEAQQIEELMNWLNFQFQATSGQITRDSLAALAEQTAVFLANSGPLKAVEPTKKRIADLLAKANQLDSLGRVNPLAVRVRLRAAYLEAVRREMMPVLVSEKFSSFLGILLGEGANELFSLRPVVELIGLGYFQDAKVMVKELSYDSLIKVLKENEEIGIEGLI